MSFDYIHDLFGKLRGGRKTKFTAVEKRAKILMSDIYNNRISYDEFYHQFWKVVKDFHLLMDNTFDEETPLWLNTFSGTFFREWSDWHQLRTVHTMHPEKFDTPELQEKYDSIEAKGYDEWLKEGISEYLRNL